MLTLTSHRDTDYLVTNRLDDANLLNLCCAVPSLTICSNDSFWRNRFLSKYGLIEKSENKTWKTLYLQLIYYMDKFIIWNERLMLAAEGGHRDLINYFISKGADNWDLGMRGAAQGGHRDLVDKFIKLGAVDWDMGMRGAAQGGHRDLVDYFISKGANNWNLGMFGAAQGGHRELVDLFISKGPRRWNLGMFGAAQGGHQDLVELFRQKMINNSCY